MSNFKVIDYHNHNSTAAFFLSESDKGVTIDVIAPNSDQVAYVVDMDEEEAWGFAKAILKTVNKSGKA